MISKIYRLTNFRFLTIILLFVSSGLYAQKSLIKHEADRLIGINRNGVTINILVGNVVLRQDSATIYCDSAILNKDDNIFDAYDNVHMIMNDSVELFGDKLFYDGDTRIGEVFDNVILIDNRATLYTDYLIYDRNLKTAYYNNHGKIIDNKNELISRIGYFYTAIDEFLFIEDVVVTNPDYVIKSDSLRYNTETEIIYFLGPTTITGEEDYMFGRDGWSDTKNSITSLKDDAIVKHKNHLLKGDSIYYEKESGFGQVFENATMTDLEKDIMIKGNFIEYFKDLGFAYATDSALAIIIDKYDSLFLHSDTLRLEFDTTNEAEFLYAYDKVKFFRKDLQGACDLLVYDVNDSIINMYANPVLWSDANQLTSDSIKIFITNQVMDSLVLYSSAFIVSQEEGEATYNQIKGRDVIGYFFQNELYQINVMGNSEIIYYVRDEETNFLTGINKGLSSNMIISLKNKKMQSALYTEQPVFTLYKVDGLTPEEQKLDGFKWLIDKRPLTKNDIFIIN